MVWFITLSFFISTPILYAGDNIKELNFLSLHDQQQMKQLNGKKVKIKGFLYINQKHEWILSAEPNLKTCCMGSKEKATQQIFLNGIFDEKWINQIIAIEGIFKFNPNGDEGRHYFLSDVIVIKEDKSYVNFILAVLGILLIFVSVILFYRRGASAIK